MNTAVRVVGDRGPHVVLLPGGGEAVDGFFPGLAEGLSVDPGCRVVLWDRPGTGASTVAGSLSGASDALHEMIRERGFGPVIVIGQSLGGAVAALLARDHPEDVAGVVLLDPSPINDVRFAVATERGVRVLAAASRLPLVGRVIRARFRASGEKRAAQYSRPDVAQAFRKASSADLPGLHGAARGLADLAREFRESDLPRVPSAVVTADRAETSPMRRAHERLAEALGADVHCWPGSAHAVHLTNPDEVLAVCRDVVSAGR